MKSNTKRHASRIQSGGSSAFYVLPDPLQETVTIPPDSTGTCILQKKRTRLPRNHEHLERSQIEKLLAAAKDGATRTLRKRDLDARGEQKARNAFKYLVR
jgi:hypothetical protein